MAAEPARLRDEDLGDDSSDAGDGSDEQATLWNAEVMQPSEETSYENYAQDIVAKPGELASQAASRAGHRANDDLMHGPRSAGAPREVCMSCLIMLQAIRNCTRSTTKDTTRSGC